MDNLSKTKYEMFSESKPEYKSLKITKDLHKRLKMYCLENDYKLMGYVEKTLNDSIYDDEIKELQKEYDITIIDKPNIEMENDGVTKNHRCETFNGTLKEVCIQNKDKKIYLYKNSLPTVRCILVDKPIVLKYPKNKEEELNKLNYLEFVGYSRIDDNPIYKFDSTNRDIILPQGYEKINMF